MGETTSVSSEVQKLNLINEHAYMPPLDEISDYQPKSAGPAPSELEKFRELNDFMRKKQEDDFFNQPFIRKYTREKWKCELYNRGCFLRMVDLLAKHPEFSSQICAKLSQFKAVIEKQDYPYKALRLRFDDYPFEEDQLPKKEVEVGWDE